MDKNIKEYIKQRGYTVQKVIRMLGTSVPTLEKIMKRNPKIIYFAIKGLPEVSHIKSQRLEFIRNKNGS